MSTESTSRGHGFGTFTGVFTPSILTILGVVMYLRMGWVLGNVGLTATVVIVSLASAITFLTSLSLAALATNMRVGGGGAYYIISRSLGVETGAAIGLPLFLAQALGIAFYIAGFSESVVRLFPQLSPTFVGIATLVLLTILAYVSAEVALKSQYVVMAAIAASLVSFFFGGQQPVTPSADAPVSLLSFWPVFAVFFPAVTGIEAGIAMSGDLKNPTRSLPLGTIAAVIIGYAVYLSIPIFLARQQVDQHTLVTDPLVMQKVARWGPAILMGIWAASLSSAVGGLLGAPRTLQALARDKVLPQIIGRGFGPHNEPRLALGISVAIGAAGILLGDLNVIAPILSMFFLTSYGVLNLSAGMEELISNPAWRPKFRVRAWVSLLGFAGCVMVMLMIAPGATIIATVIVSAIYVGMKRRSLRAEYGDIRLGLMTFASRLLLYRMEDYKVSERTWKPNLLVLSGSPTARWHLIELADAIAQSRSFVTVAAFIPEENWTAERLDDIAEVIRGYLMKRKVPAFIRTLPATDPFEGAATMIRSYGFGPLRPNTILIGETRKPASYLPYAGLIRLVHRSRRNLVIVRQPETPRDEAAVVEPAPRKSESDGGRRTIFTGSRATARKIHLWWSPTSQNTPLMLAIATLLRRSETWSGSSLLVRTVVDSERDCTDATRELERFLAQARLVATTEVMVAGGRKVIELIGEASRDADLVFMGLRPPGEAESPEEYAAYYESRLQMTSALKATAFVMAGEQLDFRRIFEAS